VVLRQGPAADKTDGKLPLTVNFSSLGSRTPEPSQSITYSWNFGDGSAASVDPNPVHTYTAAGVYTAVLTVTTRRAARRRRA
jgi:PKD repeat protein